MNLDSAEPASMRRGSPLLLILASFPIACFTCALMTDLAYARTADMLWADFSAWLLAVGMAVGGLAALAGVVTVLARRRGRDWSRTMTVALGSVLTLAVALANNFVHSRDAWTSVVPEGLALSAITVLLMLATAWVAWRLPAAARAPRLAGRLALMGVALTALMGAAPDAFDRRTQIGAHPVLPEPQQYLLPPMNVARVVGWKAGETPSVPAGLTVTAMATGLQHPRSMYTLPNGDVLVVESQGPNLEPVTRPKTIVMHWIESHATSAGARQESNRITLLRSTRGDGNYDVRSVFIDHLFSPFGVTLVGADLYVADTDAILRFPYTPGATSITAPGTRLTRLPGGPIDHHWTKSLVASEDGTKLYAGVGSNSNITENGIGAELDRASIWEIDRATGAHRIFADGLRNPNGLSWQPQSHALWAVVNERDELGPNLVPDYLTSVQDGGFYGWPYSYYGQHLDPRVQPQRPDLVAKAIVPDYALSSHVAPLGLVFDTGDGLPTQYRGGAFVGEHGSWDRQILNGYKVVFVPFANGQPNGPAEDVVTGFLDAHDSARGRPVGLALDKAGALLIADDVGNTVWRVTAAPRSPAS